MGAVALGGVGGLPAPRSDFFDVMGALSRILPAAYGPRRAGSVCPLSNSRPHLPLSAALHSPGATVATPQSGATALQQLHAIDHGRVGAGVQGQTGEAVVPPAYWHQLYVLRHAVDHDAGDQGPHAYARECFVFRCLARIRPKSKAEAVSVFRYLADNDQMHDTEADSILMNLIG
jgi:hypothetical protein